MASECRGLCAHLVSTSGRVDSSSSMTFLPSASVLFQVPKINVFFDMFVLGFGSSCRKIGANPGLMSVWRLSRGTNCPGPECGARAKPKPNWSACRSKVGTAACSVRKSIRDVTSSTPPPTNCFSTTPFRSSPRGKTNGLTASNKRPPTRKSRKTIRAVPQIWRIGERHCRTAPCLGSAPAKLDLSSHHRPSFWLPLFPVLLGWEWAQTECEVIAQMPLLVPTKHWQPRSQHGSCFCSPSPSAVVWAMPTTRRGVSQCSATTAPPRDLVRAW